MAHEKENTIGQATVSYQITPYEKLNFTSDFIFWKVLTTDLDLCRELLERILDISIQKVEVVTSQKAMQLEAGTRGIRLDAYVNDAEGTVYDVEMQATRPRELPKRLRYYQGMIDLNMIESGSDYKELKKSYIIFICMEDMFGRDRAVYRFCSICKDDVSLLLEDDTEKIVLNAAGNRDGLSEELQHFLNYLVTHIPEDGFTEELDQNVALARNNVEWRAEYMTLQMKYQEKYEDGMTAGIIIGEERGEKIGEKRGEERGEKNGGLKMLYELAKKGKLSIEDAASEAAEYGVKNVDDFLGRAKLAGYDLSKVE